MNGYASSNLPIWLRKVIAMKDTNISAGEQQRRVLDALREAPQSTFDLRSRYNVMHPGARIQELREMGYDIDTIRQARIDDYGRKHPGVALYVLLGERKCV